MKWEGPTDRLADRQTEGLSQYDSIPGPIRALQTAYMIAVENGCPFAILVIDKSSQNMDGNGKTVLKKRAPRRGKKLNFVQNTKTRPVNVWHLERL